MDHVIFLSLMFSFVILQLSAESLIKATGFFFSFVFVMTLFHLALHLQFGIFCHILFFIFRTSLRLATSLVSTLRSVEVGGEGTWVEGN